VYNALRAWGPAAAWAAVLFLSSAQSELGTVGWLSTVPDKVLHLILYAVLGAALAHARFWGAPRMPHAVILALGALYGASDELHQSFVPNRVPSVGDWLADLAGLGLGYVTAWLIATALLGHGDGNSRETVG